MQIGIASFGYEKCAEGFPTIFTRLTKNLVEWINTETENEENQIEKLKKA